MQIETERLVLRPMEPSDIDEFVSLHAAPEVMRYFGPYARAQARERLRSDRVQWRERGYGLMAMIERATGRFVGRIGLRYWPQWDETDVGWVLSPGLWGRGLATEAARACVEWGFGPLDLACLTALIEPGNARSIRVAERLGMAPVRREFVFERDMVVYALTRARRGGRD